jgi:hypothetical protein
MAYQVNGKNLSVGRLMVRGKHADKRLKYIHVGPKGTTVIAPEFAARVSLPEYHCSPSEPAAIIPQAQIDTLPRVLPGSDDTVVLPQGLPAVTQPEYVVPQVDKCFPAPEYQTATFTCNGDILRKLLTVACETSKDSQKMLRLRICGISTLCELIRIVNLGIRSLSPSSRASTTRGATSLANPERQAESRTEACTAGAGPEDRQGPTLPRERRMKSDFDMVVFDKTKRCPPSKYLKRHKFEKNYAGYKNWIEYEWGPIDVKSFAAAEALIAKWNMMNGDGPWEFKLPLHCERCYFECGETYSPAQLCNACYTEKMKTKKPSIEPYKTAVDNWKPAKPILVRKEGDIWKFPKSNTPMWTDQWGYQGSSKTPYIISHRTEISTER